MHSTYPTIKHETAATREARGLLPENEHPAEEALRSLACWLGAGGYNSPTVDAKVFEEKIRWGVDHLLDGERERIARTIEMLGEKISSPAIIGEEAHRVGHAVIENCAAAVRALIGQA